MYCNQKTNNMKPQCNFTSDEIKKFVENLVGNWIFRINRAGNIMFCYADKNGKPKNQAVYFTMYKKDGRIYFRRTRYGYQYLLFRDWIRGLETFSTIDEAVMRFNAYGYTHTEYLWSSCKPYFGHGSIGDFKYVPSIWDELMND